MKIIVATSDNYKYIETRDEGKLFTDTGTADGEKEWVREFKEVDVESPLTQEIAKIYTPRPDIELVHARSFTQLMQYLKKYAYDGEVAAIVLDGSLRFWVTQDSIEQLGKYSGQILKMRANKLLPEDRAQWMIDALQGRRTKKNVGLDIKWEEAIPPIIAFMGEDSLQRSPLKGVAAEVKGTEGETPSSVAAKLADYIPMQGIGTKRLLKDLFDDCKMSRDEIAWRSGLYHAQVEGALAGDILLSDGNFRGLLKTLNARRGEIEVLCSENAEHLAQCQAAEPLKVIFGVVKSGTKPHEMMDMLIGDPPRPYQPKGIFKNSGYAHYESFTHLLRNKKEKFSPVTTVRLIQAMGLEARHSELFNEMASAKPVKKPLQLLIKESLSQKDNLQRFIGNWLSEWEMTPEELAKYINCRQSGGRIVDDTIRRWRDGESEVFLNQTTADKFVQAFSLNRQYEAALYKITNGRDVDVDSLVQDAQRDIRGRGALVKGLCDCSGIPVPLLASWIGCTQNAIYSWMRNDIKIRELQLGQKLVQLTNPWDKLGKNSSPDTKAKKETIVSLLTGRELEKSNRDIINEAKTSDNPTRTFLRQVQSVRGLDNEKMASAIGVSPVNYKGMRRGHGRPFIEEEALKILKLSGFKDAGEIADAVAVVTGIEAPRVLLQQVKSGALPASDLLKLSYLRRGLHQQDAIKAVGTTVYEFEKKPGYFFSSPVAHKAAAFVGFQEGTPDFLDAMHVFMGHGVRQEPNAILNELKCGSLDKSTAMQKIVHMTGKTSVQLYLDLQRVCGGNGTISNTTWQRAIKMGYIPKGYTVEVAAVLGLSGREQELEQAFSISRMGSAAYMEKVKESNTGRTGAGLK